MSGDCSAIRFTRQGAPGVPGPPAWIRAWRWIAGAGAPPKKLGARAPRAPGPEDSTPPKQPKLDLLIDQRRAARVGSRQPGRGG